MKTRLLFLAVVTPVAVLGRPFWRARLALNDDPDAATYWRLRGETVTGKALKEVR